MKMDKVGNSSIAGQDKTSATGDVVSTLCNLTAELGGWAGLLHIRRHVESKNDEVSSRSDALTFTCKCSTQLQPRRRTRSVELETSYEARLLKLLINLQLFALGHIALTS